MKTATPPKINVTLRDEWLGAIETLLRQISAWTAGEDAWEIERGETEPILEKSLGTYVPPMLTIHTPNGEVRVEPIARNAPGSGIVEMYAWPTLRRVRLIHEGKSETWKVLTDSGIYLRQAWDKDNFRTLVTDLIDAG